VMADSVIVLVPGLTFRMSGAESALWLAFGQQFRQAVAIVGEETALSIMLSRATCELRRSVGVEAAKKVCEGLAASMDAAAKNDVDD
jgi:hypothetical protein